MRKSLFSFLGARLLGQGGGVMEVGGQECPEEMLLGKTFSAGGGQKDSLICERRFQPSEHKPGGCIHGTPKHRVRQRVGLS